MSNSELMQGNSAFRQKNYKAAIEHYMRAKAINPELAHLMSGNIELAKRRIGAMPAPDKNRVSSVDVVVPVYNALEDVQKCLASLQRNTDGFNVRIIVVNDGSEQDTTQWLREFCNGKPLFQLIEHAKNSGYTKAVNTGLKASNADYAVTQNSDTIVSKGWLMGLIRCMESAPSIGIVGPLSNAASWQNVPDLHDETGAFAVNEIPNGYSVDEMAELVRSASTRVYPRLPFANGFCFMIKKAVFEKIGFMDEENFPIGYGEENDFCIRAIDAGFEIAIADDTYVFHAKSKSFGHENRKKLSQQGTESLKRKHTAAKYFSRVEAVKKTEELDEVRKSIIRYIKKHNKSETSLDLNSIKILFLLPVKGGGGGAHSVVQEVAEMRRLGLHVNIGMKYEQVQGFLNNYEEISDAKEIFVGFDDSNILSISEDYDIVIGTVFTSMTIVKRIVESFPHILPAYYVQDYEPMFFEKKSEKWQQAFDSYTLVKGAFLFAKTDWIAEEVYKNHRVEVFKVSPSIDHEVYKPHLRSDGGVINVTAMIRPQTPYRGAHRTMRILASLKRKYTNKISVNIFGCDSDNVDFSKLERDFSFQNHGVLKRPQVARLLSDSDLFIDLSDYQAFGRTALEAMACGCASAVPKNGGANEYAIHNKNAIVLDSEDEDACYGILDDLIGDSERLKKLQQQGLLTAAKYSVHEAAVSEFIPLFNALKNHRKDFPIQKKSSLILIPSRRGDGLMAGSGFVRVGLPYQAAAIRQKWKVKVDEALPEPGSADVVLIQRDAASFTLQHLKDWHKSWKKAGGKLIFEIDDDLLDADGLRNRGFKGDIENLRKKIIFLASSADAVTVSTQPLAEVLSLYNNNVHVVPNFLDRDLWKLQEERNHKIGEFAKTPGSPVRIGYIGTPTHDADLELISHAMQRIKEKYGDRVEIEVIGGFQHKKPTFGKRVPLPKSTDYPSFVNWLLKRVHWDIGIIPLVDDSFNKSKSNLKFLEYSALEMAIVVSDVMSYKNVAKQGVNSIVVNNNTESWISAIENLIDNENLRMSISKSALNDVKCFSAIEKINKVLGEF